MKETSHAYSKLFVKKAEVYAAATATVAVGDAEAIDIGGARSISIQLIEEGTVNNRAGAITLYLSNDGVNFTACNMLIDNVTNTNSQDITRVATKSRNSAGSDILFLDKKTIGGFTYMKIPLAVTDGAAPTGTFKVLANICF